MSEARIQFLFQPARALSRADLAQLARELHETACRTRPDAPSPAACEPAALAERVLAIARGGAGDLVGFASARLLHVPGLGEALYLEVVRAAGPQREPLSVRLAGALVGGYCLRFTFPARLWCVFDGAGPSRLGDAADSERALSACCAVDEVARRRTRPAAGVPERWGAWLAGALLPVARFELDGRALETGYVSPISLVTRAVRQRLARLDWPRGPAAASRPAV
jgi:hypothetical protein